MRASTHRTILGVVSIGLALGIACARSSDRPAASTRPVVVPRAATDEDEASESNVTNEAIPERERRQPGRAEHDESKAELEVDVTSDGGVYSFSARTVRDGGFSFRFSASVSVTSDGGSIDVKILPDAGAP